MSLPLIGLEWGRFRRSAAAGMFPMRSKRRPEPPDVTKRDRRRHEGNRSMAGLDLKGLIGKLNPVCQRALEGAAGLCLSRTNYNVEVEHWLTKLLEQPGNDICLLLKHFDIDQGRVLTDLTKAIDRLKTGNARPPLLSPEVCDLTKQAWLIASVDFSDEKVRGAWLLLALISDESLSQRLLAASDEFLGVLLFIREVLADLGHRHKGVGRNEGMSESCR